MHAMRTTTKFHADLLDYICSWLVCPSVHTSADTVTIVAQGLLCIMRGFKQGARVLEAEFSVMPSPSTDCLETYGACLALLHTLQYQMYALYASLASLWDVVRRDAKAGVLEAGYDLRRRVGNNAVFRSGLVDVAAWVRRVHPKAEEDLTDAIYGKR